MGYHVVTADGYFPFGRRGESCHDSHSRGLPCTIWAQETDYFAFENFERDIDHGRVWTVILGHMLNLDQLLTPVSAYF